MSEVTLYAKDNLGRIREWTIRAVENGLEIEHGLYGGSMQIQFEQIEHGKSTRTLDEQIMLQMSSRIHKKRDAGYVHRLEDAQLQARTNVLGLKRPMLAQTYEHPSKVSAGAYWQLKYNGFRCLVKKTASGVVAYSRNGKLIESIDHITETISTYMDEGDTWDGELYCHGETLQTIASWTKKKQPNTKKIKYHIYDMISNAPFAERYRALQEALQDTENLPFTLVPTTLVSSDTAGYRSVIGGLLRAARLDGYEGLMIRHGSKPYEDGKRSSSLLKVKVWLDEEYQIVGISESKDGWGILECKLPNGSTFSVSAPGTIQQKKDVLKRPDEFIGKWVTVQYAELTKDGIPFHPVATQYRNKEEE